MGAKKRGRKMRNRNRVVRQWLRASDKGSKMAESLARQFRNVVDAGGSLGDAIARCLVSLHVQRTIRSVLRERLDPRRS